MRSVPVTLEYHLPKCELRNRRQAEGADTLRRFTIYSIRGLLYVRRERDCFPLQLLLKLVDERNFPFQPLYLPSSKGKCKDGDAPNNDDGRCNPWLSFRLVGRG